MARGPRRRSQGSCRAAFAVPAGAFDSGINEVILSSDAPIQLQTWQWVDDGERDRSVRLFRAQ